MFYYYGGKKRIASKYPKPSRKIVVEPFAGAAGYSVFHLMKNNILEAHLYEKDPRVVELWNRLLSLSSEEVLSIKTPNVGDKTSDFFFMTAATGNAVAKCKTMTVTERMPRVIEIMKGQIAEALPFVRGRIKIFEKDYSEAPNTDSTWFIDPPYQLQKSDKESKTIFSKGRGYAKNCTSDEIDFLKLAEYSKSRAGEVIVAEQYGADWLDFTPLVESNDSLGKSKKEVIWYRK